MNLGMIKEESIYNNMRASFDSTMQALLNSSTASAGIGTGHLDGGGPPNLGDIATNPETREFILYLQQV